MRTISFVVQGEPVAKGRPRFSRRGSFIHTYTPEKTKDYEVLVQQNYTEQCNGEYAGDSPLIINIDAYFPIPKSVSKIRRQRMISNEIMKTTKPDFDNVGKSICDALNGLAWKDDSQIVEATIRKFYSDAPHTVVTITVLE